METETKAKEKKLSETAEKLKGLLSSEGKTIDVLVQESGVEISKAKTNLRNLEKKGLCRRDKSTKGKMVFYSV